MIARRESAPSFAALALLCAALAPGSSGAQPADPAPLFASHDVLALTLNVPVRQLVNNRLRRPEVVGTLSYVGADGVAAELDVEVTTRGHSRLEICRFPPLSLNFSRGEVEGTLFAGQNRLKLVTLCRDVNEYAQYLQLEYLIYRFYDEVSGYAFRARPAQIRYVDIERDGRVLDAPAFFIEHIDGLAARLGMEPVEAPSIDASALEPRELARLGVFQFFIGNTDWSVTSAAEGEDCCHNTDLLGARGGTDSMIGVPYDFDQAGFINAAYALPNERLRIRSVRQRLYRGLCSVNGHLNEVIADFVTARPAIESLLADAPLDSRFRDDAQSYLEEFYQVVDDPRKRQSEILDACRGGRV